MPHRQSLPRLWLLSDARNDAVLEASLAALPPGSGFVFRHYHLGAEARRARFAALGAVAEAPGHLSILSGPPELARQWGADGFYAPAGAAGQPDLLTLATAHDAREIELANGAGADGVFLSPVFPTRSHRGAAALGPEAFHRLAALAEMPAIALGGMNAARARELGWPRWAGIDGLSVPIG